MLPNLNVLTDVTDESFHYARLVKRCPKGPKSICDMIKVGQHLTFYSHQVTNRLKIVNDMFKVILWAGTKFISSICPVSSSCSEKVSEHTWKKTRKVIEINFLLATPECLPNHKADLILKTSNKYLV